jgi:hypothetical protein
MIRLVGEIETQSRMVLWSGVLVLMKLLLERVGEDLVGFVLIDLSLRDRQPSIAVKDCTQE